VCSLCALKVFPFKTIHFLYQHFPLAAHFVTITLFKATVEVLDMCRYTCSFKKHHRGCRSNFICNSSPSIQEVKKHLLHLLKSWYNRLATIRAINQTVKPLQINSLFSIHHPHLMHSVHLQCCSNMLETYSSHPNRTVTYSI